ncbi:MAG: biotin synthase BioB, partial [Thermotogae bacterium]|nr:biotin synthase BioB [Thermotogota bacterium]
MREELLRILSSKPEEFYSLLTEAFKLKNRKFGTFIETCAIVNAKSGLCPSDCKFCAQSAKFKVKVKTYPLLKEEELYSAALKAFERGINRFSFVISGISPTKEDLKTIGRVIERLKTKNAEF